MGKLVLTRLQGALNVGLVIGYHGEKAQVRLFGEGEDRKIRREALIWIGPNSPAGLEDIDPWLDAQFQTMFDGSKNISVNKLWEQAWNLSNGDVVQLTSLIRLEGSNPEEGALVVALELDRGHFKRRPGGYSPFSPEERSEREARRTSPWSSQWREVRLDLFKKYLSTGSIPSNSAPWSDVVNILASLGVATDQTGYPGRERRFLEEALSRPVLRPSDEATELLQSMGIWASDEPVEAHREGIPLYHSPAVEEAAQKLSGLCHEERGMSQSRTRMVESPWVAIDEASTNDVDDALFARRVGENGEICVHVAIADPGEWITPTSELWEAARKRGSSMYLPRGVYGMLPETLSDHFSSLIPGEERLALIFSWVVNEKGHVRDFDIREGMIKLECRATYEEVDEAIALGSRPMWEVLREAAARMRMRRGNAGGLLLRQLEWKCSMDSSNAISVKKLDPFSPARETVSELMIASGILSGEYCSAESVPGIFRTQAPPDIPPDYPVDGLTDAAELYELFRTMKRAEMATHPGSHYMLGARAYTQVSSPLRRFCDLVMHHQLKTYLRTGSPAWSERELMQEIEGVETAVRTRLKVERERHRVRVLEMFEKDPKQAIRGQVVRRMGRRHLVALLDLGIREATTLQGGTEVGDFVTLHLGEVSSRQNILKLVHR